jgi:ABC-2 type transport system ATP-binding protein
MTMDHPLVELIGITKCFRSNWTFRPARAIEDLSFAITEGEVFGLIGHNGAGKTTTFKLLVGLLRPTSGTLLWQGRPLAWHHPRQQIGFSPEQPYFYEYLTVAETLNFYGQLYGMDGGARRTRIGELADQFRIAHKLSAPMRTLSKGTLQRVAVAQAIMHRPRLVILDEPMSGLDPVGRKEMRDLIATLKHDGTTVLFSSHILSDAEALCNRVAILGQGRLHEIINLDTASTPSEGYTLIVVGTSCRALTRLAHLAGEPPLGGPERWTVKIKDRATVNALLPELHGSGLDVEAILPERPSLERRFLRHAANDSNGD